MPGLLLWASLHTWYTSHVSSWSSCFFSVVRAQKVAASVPPTLSTTTRGPFWYSRCQSCTRLTTPNTL